MLRVKLDLFNSLIASWVVWKKKKKSDFNQIKCNSPQLTASRRGLCVALWLCRLSSCHRSYTHFILVVVIEASDVIMGFGSVNGFFLASNGGGLPGNRVGDNTIAWLGHLLPGHIQYRLILQ